MAILVSSPDTKNSWWHSLPVMQGLLPLNRLQLGSDIMAGITLAAVGIPEVMGYTKIIGTPVVPADLTLASAFSYCFQ
jgi:sulfate permease, SulP family